MARKFRERFKTLNDVFDEFTLRNLFVLSSKDFFEEGTLSPVSIGKEANVFSAKRGRGRVILKIYRLETADFNKMFSYIKPDPRYASLAKRRRDTVFAWSQREYRNLLAAREVMVRAPVPLTFMKNILVMSFVGDSQPAPKVKDAIPQKPKEFMDDMVANMKKLYASGFVHGDLSKFNILNHNEQPVLIDFSQASPVKSPLADEMLERDVRNVCTFFRQVGVECNDKQMHKRIVGGGFGILKGMRSFAKRDELK